MPERSIVRVAPSRDGVQAANAWRIWIQGDEFYAGSRSMAHDAKISFHRHLNWQFRVDKSVTRLAPPLRLSDGWLHALEISFLVDQGVLQSMDMKPDKVKMIETPTGQKLLINLMLSSHNKRPGFIPPKEIGGQLVGAQRLRSGATFIVTHRVMSMTDSDRTVIQDLRSKLKVTYNERPPKEDVYVEAFSCSFSDKTGNVVAVVTTGYETVQ